MARVGFILDEGFEESEFRVPYDAVKLAGHTPTVIGLALHKQLHAKTGGFTVDVDKGIVDISASEIDALVVPGGRSPDHLRGNPGITTLVTLMMEQHKPLAAICHGPSVLIDAAMLEGRVVTSAPSIKADLTNAGALWVDKEVAVDGNLITSRGPQDLPAFCLTFTSMLANPQAVVAAEAAREAQH